MTWTRFMGHTLDLWLLLAALFAVFVSATVWRAAIHIRLLRRRLEELSRDFGPPQEFPGVEFGEAGRDGPGSLADADWVPRR